jgi:hypothetical protein
MSQHQHDPVLATAFTRARALEPTDAEIAAVVERVDRRGTWVGARGPECGAHGRRRCSERLWRRCRGCSRGPRDRARCPQQTAVSAGAYRPCPAIGAEARVDAGGAASAADRRRPDTPRLAGSQSRLSSGGTAVIVPGLTRLVATVPDAAGRRGGRSSPRLLLYLIVTAPTFARGAGVRPRGYPGDLVSIAWVTAAGRPAANGVSRGVPAALLHGIPTMRLLSTQAGYNVGIVPDRVTRVRWSFVDGTAYPTVQHNIVLAPSTRSTNVGNGAQTIAVYKPKYLAGVTWYGSHGEVISSFTPGPRTRLQPGSSLPRSTCNKRRRCRLSPQALSTCTTTEPVAGSR